MDEFVLLIWLLNDDVDKELWVKLMAEGFFSESLEVGCDLLEGVTWAVGIGDCVVLFGVDDFIKEPIFLE